MAAAPLRFDGKVVLVTGAGNGLGKAYALDFAARGAKVVVNDLGGDIAGKGSGSRAADKVVEEIRSNGGTAVPNYDSVEHGEKLVQTALDSFGRIDIIVNNAGILRDKSFTRIRNEDWDIIHSVHLRGSFLVTRAAWPHMRKNGYGRIVMVTSAAGIYGNFGQANYSAAKLGAVGLSNTLAVEGRKFNIHCNAIAPFAGSRLTATVMDKELLEALKPEYVSPLVVYLCHDSCKETGSLFEVGAGYFGKLRWQRSEGLVLREPNKTLDAEKVRDNWDRITDLSRATYPRSIQDSLGIMLKIQKEKDAQDKAVQDALNNKDPMAIAKTFFPPSVEYTYTEKEAMLYALGVGVSTCQADHLKFLFELSDDFRIVPSFGVIPATKCFMENYLKVPGITIDNTKLLHGEQYLEIYKPLQREGKLTSQLRIADVLDKGSGMNILYNVDTFDERGNKVTFNQFSIFITGAGNFGGKKTSSEVYPIAKSPSRDPDAIMEEKTSIDQAPLFRLNGDYNPIHIDSDTAAKGGLKGPILHGLCTLGYSVRHVMTKLANNQSDLFKSLKARFTKPVFPGQTLRTEMWKEGCRVHYTTKVVETNDIVIAGAYIDLHPSLPPKSNVKSAETLKSNNVFKQLGSKVKAFDPSTTGKAVYQWNITQDGQLAASWTMDLSSNEIYFGKPRPGPADCTLTLSDQVFVDLVSGKVDTQKALLKGNLDIAGDASLAQRLSQLFITSKI